MTAIDLGGRATVEFNPGPLSRVARCRLWETPLSHVGPVLGPTTYRELLGAGIGTIGHLAASSAEDLRGRGVGPSGVRQVRLLLAGIGGLRLGMAPPSRVPAVSSGDAVDLAADPRPRPRQPHRGRAGGACRIGVAARLGLLWLERCQAALIKAGCAIAHGLLVRIPVRVIGWAFQRFFPLPGSTRHIDNRARRERRQDVLISALGKLVAFGEPIGELVLFFSQRCHFLAERQQLLAQRLKPFPEGGDGSGRISARLGEIDSGLHSASWRWRRADPGSSRISQASGG